MGICLNSPPPFQEPLAIISCYCNELVRRERWLGLGWCQHRWRERDRLWDSQERLVIVWVLCVCLEWEVKTQRYEDSQVLCSTPECGGAAHCTLAQKHQGYRTSRGREEAGGERERRGWLILKSTCVLCQVLAAHPIGYGHLLTGFCLKINMSWFAFWVTMWRELMKGKQLDCYNSDGERKCWLQIEEEF